MPLTREELDAMQCGNPDCDHESHRGEPIVLRALCHDTDSLQVQYLHGTGVIRVVCHRCDKHVVSLHVASTGDLVVH